MAKINHNNSLDTIDELFTDAKSKKIMHLTADIPDAVSRKLPIDKKELLNFGTCGYLALEQDNRLIEGSMEYTQKYGTQYGISRGFLSSGINEELENYLSKIFDNKPTIIYSSTSSGHISVIPTLITHDDAIILDQQVHMSIQTACQLMRQKGVPIEMIRHSNLEMLERMIVQLSRKHKKVWYMIDGVYSMYGDIAPMDELHKLLDKYPCLNIYIDDAHGMSWYGKNGTGYVYSKTLNHERIMFMTTMGKGFGVTGGIAVFSNKENYRRVRIFGGPLVYSHPVAPPIIGAALASAKIHLSEDIYRIQNELKENIDYCNELLEKSNLVVMSNPLTPIKFVGMGHSKVAGKMVKQLLNDGFFVSPALFPAVSMKNSGIRISINRNVKKEEIKKLIDAIHYYYPEVLEEENKTMEDVEKAFKVKKYNQEIESRINVPSIKSESNGSFMMEEENTIDNINKAEWNSLLGQNGSFDWDGMKSLEDVFKGNQKPHENWEFYYFIIRDSNKKPIIATFFTSTILKDDMLSLEAVSSQIEEKRKKDPYYLASKSITMGSMLTEGQHCYVDRNNSDWKKAFVLLLDRVSQIQDNIKANNLLLRDFDKNDEVFKDFFMNEGFAPMDMPNANVIDNFNWNTKDEFLKTLSFNSRKHVKKEALRHEHKFIVEYKKNLTDYEAEYFYDLYINVEHSNRGFNMFDYPKNILNKLSKHPNWEFLILKLKAEHTLSSKEEVVAVIWYYLGKTHMSPMIIGMDYSYNSEFKVYKQAMYQIVNRAKMLNLNKIYLGLSADIEKKKYGAIQHPKVVYVQTKDNYNMEVIESMSALPAHELA